MTSVISHQQLIKSCEHYLSSLTPHLNSAANTDVFSNLRHEAENHDAMQELISLAETDRNINKTGQKLIRETFSDLYKASGLLDHAIAKPYGYPGDFELLEHVYENQPFPNSNPLGKLVDSWALNTELPNAVRERKNILRDFIKYNSDSTSSILSIASGSVRELREIKDFNAKLSLIDHDQKTFDFFRENTSIDLTNVHFEKYDLSSGIPKLYNQAYDIIYSFGLYDYLSDEQIALSVLPLKQKALHDDSTFIFCIKDHRYYSRWFYDWWCDWRFKKRTHESGIRLAETLGFKVKDMILSDNKAVAVYICKL